MKYYSDLTKKIYDTEDELTDAEKTYEKEQEDKKQEALKVSNRKKELSKKIQDADDKITSAHNMYDMALQDIKKLSEEYTKKCDEIISAAKKTLNDAEREKYEAVLEFNKEFGPYRTTYTGEKASEQFNRIQKQLERSCRNFFDNWFLF